jgi:hypothetical protein
VDSVSYLTLGQRIRGQHDGRATPPFEAYRNAPRRVRAAAFELPAFGPYGSLWPMLLKNATFGRAVLP